MVAGDLAGHRFLELAVELEGKAVLDKEARARAALCQPAQFLAG